MAMGKNGEKGRGRPQKEILTPTTHGDIMERRASSTQYLVYYFYEKVIYSERKDRLERAENYVCDDYQKRWPGSGV